jgi:hypothetical protein
MWHAQRQSHPSEMAPSEIVSKYFGLEGLQRAQTSWSFVCLGH